MNIFRVIEGLTILGHYIDLSHDYNDISLRRNAIVVVGLNRWKIGYKDMQKLEQLDWQWVEENQLFRYNGLTR